MFYWPLRKKHGMELTTFNLVYSTLFLRDFRWKRTKIFSGTICPKIPMILCAECHKSIFWSTSDQTTNAHAFVIYYVFFVQKKSVDFTWVSTKVWIQDSTDVRVPEHLFGKESQTKGKLYQPFFTERRKTTVCGCEVWPTLSIFRTRR